jgi:hypothetical protein
MSKAKDLITPILARRAAMDGIAAAAPMIAAAPTGDALSVSERRAARARAEEIVSLLRTSYVREGWQMDEAFAERMLTFFRKHAGDGSAPPDDEWEVALDFLYSHGQSLDWVLWGDPRVMICKLVGADRTGSVIAGGW